MDYKIKENLIKRNNQIIDKVLNEINSKYPGSVDLIAIAGSFASGLFYEKSDLDLLIIENDTSAENISKCFIYDEVGHDIYVSRWNRLEKMANYDNHFVTKLKNLVFVYTKDDSVMEKYKKLQKRLDYNMNDTNSINLKIGKYLGDVISIQKSIINDNNINSCYKKLGTIMNLVETIIYMINKKYCVGGTKNIPAELSKMEFLPIGFMEKYLKLLECNSKNDIKLYTDELLAILIQYFNDNSIKIINNMNKELCNNVKKKEPTKNEFIGTYEELYSNYYNKLLHASNTNNKFVSFRTMVDIQSFFDEFTEIYNIPDFNLIDKYNPNDLQGNFNNFEKLLNDWKEIYNKLDIDINILDSLDELYV